MSILTLVVVAILVLSGVVVVGIESGALERFKRPAVGVLVLLVGVAVLLFLKNDADGKINWGDPIAASKTKGDGGSSGGGGGGKGGGDSNDGGGKGGGGGDGGGGAAGGGGGGDGDGEKQAGGGSGEQGDGGDQAGGGGDSGSGGGDEEAADGRGGSVAPELKTFKDCDVCPVMVSVPPGEFKMGAPGGEFGRRYFEGPVRKMAVPRGFAVSRAEITLAEYMAFVRETRYRPSQQCIINGMQTPGANYLKPGYKQDLEFPVVCVTWKDARVYTKWLSDKTGETYRLLSEAEWEYAARGGSETVYWSGDGIARLDANYRNQVGSPASALAFKANRFSLRNVHGNVSEWVEDCWHDTLDGRVETSVPWLKENDGDCKARVIRGGAWNSDATEIRSASRNFDLAKIARNTTGIRVAKSEPHAKKLVKDDEKKKKKKKRSTNVSRSQQPSGLMQGLATEALQ